MALDNCTDRQRKCIEELRERMTGLMNKEMYEDDAIFKRFLVARNYNMSAAELMLKNHLNWRKVNKIDTILEDYKPSEVATNYIAAGPLGYTRDGFPVTFSRFGNIDFKGILKSVKKSEVYAHVIYILERDLAKAKSKSEEMGKPIDRFFFIFDLSNFSLATATYKPALDIMIRLITMFDANYPERLRTAYLINASLYFTIFWSVVSPFLAGETFKKVKVYAKDGWINDMTKDVDADIIPAFIGGNLTDPDGDPMCRTLIHHGGLVPETYYSKKDNSFRKKLTTQKLIVQRMSKETIEINVEKPGSILEWEFDVKTRDINFCVLYKDTDNIDSEPIKVVPDQRIETVISSETGMFRCENAGTYILEFDNTYSWMYSKELYYTTSVLQSDQITTEM